MNQNDRKQLEACGVDFDTAMERFMDNEAMYEKFLVKFLEDKNFEILKESIDKNDAESAFNAAHTMKGVAANLELNGLLRFLMPIVEILRQNKTEGTNELIKNMDEEYEMLRQAIKGLTL